MSAHSTRPRKPEKQAPAWGYIATKRQLDHIKWWINGWLSGTTCKYSKLDLEWCTPVARFILVKHYGHSVYINVFVGNSYCETYYEIYDTTEKPPPYGSMTNSSTQPLWQHKGRLNKAKREEAMEIIKTLEKAEADYEKNKLPSM